MPIPEPETMKPCPLCGNAGGENEGDQKTCLYAGTSPPYCMVGCRRCGLSVSVNRGSQKKTRAALHPTLGEARRRWNLLPRNEKPPLEV